MTPLQYNPIPLFVRLLGGKLGSALRSGTLIHLPDQCITNERPKHQARPIGIDSITRSNVTRISG